LRHPTCPAMFRRRSLDQTENLFASCAHPAELFSPASHGLAAIPTKPKSRSTLAPSEGLAHLAEMRQMRAEKKQPAVEPGNARRVALLDIKVAEAQNRVDELTRTVGELTKANEALVDSNERLSKENRELRARSVRKRDDAREASSSKRTRGTAPPPASSSTIPASSLCKATPHTTRECSSDDVQEETLEIKIEALPKGTNSNSLLGLVDEHGRVASVRVTRSATGTLNGYVAFKSRANAMRAMDALRSTGYHVQLCTAKPKSAIAAAGAATGVAAATTGGPMWRS
jgi:FtsZ-binding cell division protein ZapB